METRGGLRGAGAWSGGKTGAVGDAGYALFSQHAFDGNSQYGAKRREVRADDGHEQDDVGRSAVEVVGGTVARAGGGAGDWVEHSVFIGVQRSGSVGEHAT